MKLIGLLIAIISAGVLAAAPKAKHTRVVARSAVTRATPSELTWKYSQRLDLNCDSVADEVFTGQDKHRFYVGVVLAPIHKDAQYSIVAFGLAGEFQDAFCGPFKSLSSEVLTAKVAEALGEEPLGYRASPSCKGLNLVAGECDSFHLYWNHMSNALDWWRL